MNPNPEPESKPKPDFEWRSTEEFEAWLKADPKNREWWFGVIERSLKGEYGEITPEMRAAGEKAMATRHVMRCIATVQAKLKAFMELTQAPAGSMLAEERLAQANALMDDATDILLETPEPHRSNFLKQLLPMREKIRALKVPE